MTRRLRYSSAARDNLRDIADYLTDDSGSEDVAEAFILELDARCRRIASLSGQLEPHVPNLDRTSDHHHIKIT